MLSKASEMKKETREKMRDGKGAIELAHVFTQEQMKNEARLCARLTLNPGCSIGYHEHVNDEEIYYIISGTGTVTDNGEKYTVSSGDAILTGHGEWHSIENTGDKPLEMLAIVMLF